MPSTGHSQQSEPARRNVVHPGLEPRVTKSYDARHMQALTRSASIYWIVPMAAMAALFLVACKKTPPPDGVCTNEPLPTRVEIPSDHGGVQVLASTDAYFMVRDTTGKQIRSEEHTSELQSLR